MAVLVTGGAGYIGSHMVLALQDLGEQVVVLDNLSTGFAAAVPKGVPLIVGDIGDSECTGRLISEFGIEAIIHFAGSIIVPESVANPLKYYWNNTAKSRNLIQCAVDGGVRHFIFSSTAAVYGMPKTNPVAEDAELQPMSPYGSSKLMTELMLADVADATDLSYVALRYFNVAGADPLGRSGQSTPQATHLIKVACETALRKRERMAIFGTDYPTDDGTCVRDYIHVSDLAAAHVCALAHLRRGGQSDVYNCGYANGYSVRDVIDTVKQVSGSDFPVDLEPRRAGDPAAIVAQSSKIRAALGWLPMLDDLETIVTHALAWEQRLAEAKLAS
ncbi:MAG: UDP-glucose 4-epimerase GalE [Pseudomonadota bacterium]